MGRLNLGYDELYDYEIKALYNKLEGFLNQKRDELESLRVVMMEQTMHLVNISGKMVKEPVTLANFGIKVKKPDPKLTEAQRQYHIKKANEIKWVVGPKGKSE